MDMRSNTPPDFTVKTDRDDLDLPAEQVVVAYHERTKHHYRRYAASLGYLDWAKSASINKGSNNRVITAFVAFRLKIPGQWL